MKSPHSMKRTLLFIFVLTTYCTSLAAATKPGVKQTGVSAPRPNIVYLLSDSCEVVKNVELQGSVSLWESASGEANST